MMINNGIHRWQNNEDKILMYQKGDAYDLI